MLKRLEHLSAVIVAAGLALVSYWLFFSWAGGGGRGARQQTDTSGRTPIHWHQEAHPSRGDRALQTTPGLVQPAAAVRILKG